MSEASKDWTTHEYIPRGGPHLMIWDSKGNRLAEAVLRENAELICRAVNRDHLFERLREAAQEAYNFIEKQTNGMSGRLGEELYSVLSDLQAQAAEEARGKV